MKSLVRILATKSCKNKQTKSWNTFAALGTYALPICNGIPSKQQQQQQL